MADNKFDITSTAVEKGLDIAKSFLEKLIFPAVEETGFLLKDKITFWKFKNQVKMLTKAQQFCMKNNIEPKNIPLKLISPMLEYSALEEDEKLQDKWAILLSNMVDSEQNIENHVFPYILSQISINEYDILETIYLDTIKSRRKAKLELEEFQINLNPRNIELQELIENRKKRISELKEEQKVSFSNEIWEVQKELTELETKKRHLRWGGYQIEMRTRMSAVIPPDSMKDFELSNVIRLGLVKEDKEVFADSQNLEIPVNETNDSGYLNYNLEIEMDYEIHHNITQLGELFLDACTEKKEKS